MVVRRVSCLLVRAGVASVSIYPLTCSFCVHWILLRTHTYIVALPPPPPPLSSFACCSAASHTYLRPASSFYPSPAYLVRCLLDVMTPLRSRACLCSIHVLSVDLHSCVTIYRTYISPRPRRPSASSAPFPSPQQNQAPHPSALGACSPCSPRTSCASASSPRSVSSPAPPR